MCWLECAVMPGNNQHFTSKRMAKDIGLCITLSACQRLAPHRAVDMNITICGNLGSCIDSSEYHQIAALRINLLPCPYRMTDDHGRCARCAATAGRRFFLMPMLGAGMQYRQSFGNRSLLHGWRAMNDPHRQQRRLTQQLHQRGNIKRANAGLFVRFPQGKR